MHACKLRGMKDREYSYSGSQDSVKKVHGNMPRPYRVTLKEAAANAEPWCSGSRSLQHCNKCCSPAHYRASSRATALDKNDVSRQATALCLLTETHLRPGEVFRLANCLPPYRLAYGGRRNSNTGPPWYRPLRYTCPLPDPVGGNCHTYNVG